MSAVLCNGLLQLFDCIQRTRTPSMVSRQLGACICLCSEIDRGKMAEPKNDQVPKVVLNNISAKVKSRLKAEMNPQYKDTLVTDVWQSSLTIKWPDNIETVGKGFSKVQAQHAAAQSALNLLKQKNVIDDDGNLQPLAEIASQYVIHHKVLSARSVDSRSVTDQVNEETQAAQSKSMKQLQESKASVSRAVLEMVARRFPQPRATLHNVFADVARQLCNDSYCAVPSYRLVRDTWLCSYRLRWPTQAVFSGEGRSKSQAAQVAALYALHWLTVQGRLLKDGTACIEKKMEIPPPLLVALPCEFEQQLSVLCSHFQRVKNTVINSAEHSSKVSEDGENNETEISHVTSSFSFNNRSEITVRKRNSELQRKLERRLEIGRIQTELPIHKFRKQLLDLLENNRVLIIKGEPGCGKSTQVPQFIFDHWTEEGNGSRCNIFVTEPRRIAAISLAERVAEERDEQVGDAVGYQVRLQSRLPQGPGGVLYMSSGMLLRHLQRNPALTGVTHVILDEAHERDTNVDVLSVLLRRALSNNSQLSLIVMSATIDAALFQKYFNAPLMEVPGFTFPVAENYLDDLLSQGVVKKLPDSTTPYIDADLVCHVINWIHESKTEGGILCFMPGWAEIKSVMDKLSNLINKNQALVVPVHSRIPFSEQRRIFSRPPPGIRKIILATNIAETSITINDVKYVVDTGLHREQRLHSDSGTSSIGNRWVSKVNVKQRRGRAGRLQPGESFHLFSRQHFEALDNFPIPEVLRVPLEKTILDCKSIVKDQTAAEFLSELPEPPSTEAVELGVSELIRIGALDHDENLTALGKRIMHFPTHPKLSKALVNAAVFRCTQPVLTISTILSGEVDVFKGSLTEKEHIRETKREYDPTSDHIALWKIHKMLQQKKNTDFRSLCQHMNINGPSIDLITRLNRLFSEYLYQSQILPSFENHADDSSPCNKYQLNDELVKAVLMSGLGNLLIKRNWKIMNGRLVKDTNLTVTELDQHATITSESVNYKQSSNSSPYFTHFNEIKSLERRSLLIRESSLISPLCVILFKPGELKAEKYEAHSPHNSTVKGSNYVVLSLDSKGTVEMLCERRDAEHLLQLRNIIQWILDYYISNEGMSENEHHNIVDRFREDLLKLLVDILSYRKQVK